MLHPSWAILRPGTRLSLDENPMKRWKSIAVLVVFFCLGVVVIAFSTSASQEFTGSINGIVIDAGGTPVEGAWVSVSCGDRPLGERIPGAISDERGHFAV